MDTILDVSGVRKRFPGVTALADAHLTVRAGEVHALVGENGAGKSTLVGVICGAVQPDTGRMRFLGEDYHPRSPQEAYQSGIRVVFQHLSLIPNLSVTDNLFLGREMAGALGFIRRRDMGVRARTLLEELGFAHIPASARVDTLSTSQKYLVEVAKAMLERPKLIILDEPTAALNAAETSVLFDLVASLKDAGSGVIWITHRLEELYQITDQVTVMRDGRFVETRPTASLERDEIIRLMTGRQIADSEAPDPAHIGSENRLVISDLYTAGGLKGLSMAVRAGEVVGLGGLAGSGVEEIGRALYGLHPVTRGEIELLGRPFRPRDLRPHRLARQGIFYLPGDRQAEGIVDVRPVSENATLSSLDALGRMGFLHRLNERRTVADYVQRLRVSTPSAAQPIKLLSGGNQQKVLFARGMLTEPRLFILEEPTQGVDVGSKADIYAVTRELAEAGAAVIVISTDTRELLTVCHRIIAISQGRMSREFTQGEADEEQLVSAYFGSQDSREAV
ncbi:sugar ABC transporter ATP-binding protein [Arhodomonas sp. KWT2]|uniref:sugar ABC transporter ATP-binding protein n=4 Tax=unclassified Arhodomonas TaxID=2621637 RepID=UPI0035C15257